MAKKEGQKTRYQDAINELYRAFDFFNERFAEGELDRPVLLISTAGRRSAYGWFGEKFWIEGEDQPVHEINISAEYMKRDHVEVLETLLHEMAHLYNAQNGVQDVSGHQYHNRHFKLAAQKFGLEVVKKGYRGFAWTSLGDEAKKAIEDLKPNKNSLLIHRKTFKRGGSDRYIQLIARREHYENLVEELVHLSGMKKREIVEEALDDMLVKYKRITT